MKKNSFKQLHSFLLLWGSQTVSQLGTAMADYAVTIWVYSRKGTVSSVTLLTLCSFLPTIFFRFLAGSMLAVLIKPGKKRIPFIFITTGLVFTGNIIQSLTSRPWLWCVAAFGSYLLVAVMNVNMDILMRERVPMEMQGRVFSAKSTLQNFTIPPALLLGGLLADTVFEPFMLADSPVQRVLSGFFGTGKGAGIGMMFFIVAIAGMAASFTRLRKPVYREPDRAETDTLRMNDGWGGNDHEQQ